ncbi:transposase [Kitasatospora sp. NPDC058170]|uniref:transposase n=1 Tax=Kitasatospora sp. NPDC058170 TaxID=3346364 RepID=UPI0036DEE057
MAAAVTAPASRARSGARTGPAMDRAPFEGGGLRRPEALWPDQYWWSGPPGCQESLPGSRAQRLRRMGRGSSGVPAGRVPRRLEHPPGHLPRRPHRHRLVPRHPARSRRHRDRLRRRRLPSLPSRECCTTAARGTRMPTLRPREFHDHVAAARAEQAAGAWQAAYALRAGVEGAVNQAPDITGLRRARYRGRPKAPLRHAFCATAINIVRRDAHRSGPQPDSTPTGAADNPTSPASPGQADRPASPTNSPHSPGRNAQRSLGRAGVWVIMGVWMLVLLVSGMWAGFRRWRWWWMSCVLSRWRRGCSRGGRSGSFLRGRWTRRWR